MPNPADPKYKNQKNKFISDCISIRMKEGDDQKRAVAACINIWAEHKKKAAASAGLDNNDEILFFDENVEDKKDER